MKRKSLLPVVWRILCACVFLLCSKEINSVLSSQGVSPQIPSAVVELGFVCDKEFTEAFGYDEDRITEYIISLVEGLEIDFQTLQSIKISFAITSIITIKSASAQPFIESERYTDGTTDLADIQWSFMLWLYKSRIASISDIVILITGSPGESRSVGVPKFLCQVDDDTKTFDSAAVMRSPLQAWHNQNDFTLLIAKMLGAQRDVDTACNETDSVMGDTYNPSTHYYFSTCSDNDIYQTLQSISTECIKETDARKYDKAILSSKRRKLSFAEQCRLRYSDNQNVTTDTIDETSCHTTRCIENKPDGPLYLDNMFPLHGTPCGENKVCFRSSCTDQGSLLINVKFQKCVLPSLSSSREKRLQLHACPKFPLQFDKFQFDYLLSVGYLITAADNTLERDLNCLAVDEGKTEVVLETNCTTTHIQRLLWDKIKLEDDNSKTIICNRYAGRCLSTNLFGQLTLEELFLDKKTLENGLWVINNNLSEQEASIQNQMPQELNYIQNAAIRLAVFCDIDCGKAFNYNLTALDNYWYVILGDARSKFETLVTIKISLLVTTKLHLWRPEFPKFARTNASDTSKEVLESTNESFGKWIFKQIPVLPYFDVAILATAFVGSEQRVFANSQSACLVDKKAKQFLGTLILQVNNPKNGNCDDLADALGKIISRNEFACPCDDNPYFFTKCQENSIRQSFRSMEDKCLKNATSSEQQTSLALLGEFFSVPSFENQCNFLQNPSDLIVKLENENCFSTLCLRNGTFSVVVRDIYPMHNTPCETNKFCQQGRCVEETYQLQSADAKRCIVGTRIFSPNDRLHLAKCDVFSSSLDKFWIRPTHENEDEYILSSPSLETEVPEKCVTIAQNAKYLQYRPCSEINEKQLIWSLHKVPKLADQFLLFHKESRLCVGVTTGLMMIPTSDCNLALAENISSCFQFRKTESLTITTECSPSNVKLRWKRVSKENFKLAHTTSSFNDTKTLIDETPSRNLSGNIKSETMAGEFYIKVSSPEPDLDLKNHTNSTSIGTMVLVAVIILITLIAAFFIIKLLVLQRRKHHQNSTNYEWLLEEDFYNGNMDRYNPELDIADQVDLLPFEKSWEFPVERLTIGKLLGSGAFANVFKAKADDILENQTMTTVAVKIISATDSSNHFSALKSELKVLCYLGRHMNVVNLLGACTKDFNQTKKLYMIIEYCKFGNLRNFLLSNRHLFVNNLNNLEQAGPHQSYRFDKNGYQDYDIKHRLKSTNTQDILLWAFQIAKGMDYLASKRVLHGDLAARNVLLAENNIVKICDFGFSKELTRGYNYNYKKCMENAKVPYKWMAVESLMCGLFSTQSDCWSFGVVMWELFSLGDSPYPGMEVDENFVSRINTGYRMEKPLYAPSRLYDIMLQCWSHNPSMRPKFSYLAELLGGMLGKAVAEYYAKQKMEFENEGLLRGQQETSFMFPTLGESAIPEDSAGYLQAVPLSQSSGDEHDTGANATCRLLENGQGFMFVKE